MLEARTMHQSGAPSLGGNGGGAVRGKMGQGGWVIRICQGFAGSCSG